MVQHPKKLYQFFHIYNILHICPVYVFVLFYIQYLHLF